MTYTVLAPTDGRLESLLQTSNNPAFHSSAIDFATTLSSEILLNPAYREYPDLLSLAFWLRKTNLATLQEQFNRHRDGGHWLARGVVFQIAPSNVDTMFVYPWFLSMLMGNRNIVRVSTALNAQTSLLLELLNRQLESDEFASVRERILIVTYEHSEQISAQFSSVCDLRMIWGGDATVSLIRSIPLPPTATEICFADKFSLSLIDAKNWLELSEQASAAQIKQFYNDAYWFGQMACSSPRMVFWLGDAEVVDRARLDFWQLLETTIGAENPDLSTGDFVNKLVAAHSVAIDYDVQIVNSNSNAIARLWFKDLDELPVDLHCGAGLFYESRIASLPELLPLLSRKIQTLSYCGVTTEQLVDFVDTWPLRGIDRIVPFGKALEFSYQWDGFNLLNALTREVVIHH